MLQPSMWLTLTNPPQSCHCTGLTWARSHHAIHQPCGCPAGAGQPLALRAAALSSSTGTATATTSTSSNQAARYLPATQPHSAAHATPAHPAAASTPRYAPNTGVHTCPAGAALHQRSHCLLARHILVAAASSQPVSTAPAQLLPTGSAPPPRSCAAARGAAAPRPQWAAGPGPPPAGR
jgi:hypothetical protein